MLALLSLLFKLVLIIEKKRRRSNVACLVSISSYSNVAQFAKLISRNQLKFICYDIACELELIQANAEYLIG